MIKLNKKPKFIYFFAILAFSFISMPSYLEAQAANQEKKQIKYKKARSLTPKTAKKMIKVYEALEEVDESGEPAPDMEVVNSILADLKSNFEGMKSYDRSVVWNALGFVAYTNERYEEAINAYNSLLAEPESTIPNRVAALYTLAQLTLMQGDFPGGIKILLQYMDEIEVIPAQAWSLLATAYYQVGDYRGTMSSIKTAIQLAEEEGYKPKENWYNLLAGSIGQLKDEIGEKKALLQQIDIYEILVNLYPKKQYFLNLGGSYGTLGREKDYMITMNAAYLKDFLDKEAEYLTLAQLLLLNQNPYWAAEVIVSGQKKITTITQTIVDKVTKEETKVEKTGPVVRLSLIHI